MTHRDLTQRYLLTSLGLLFAASVGAFLLYVPMMSAIAVLTIMLGMICMFALGFMARKSRTYRTHTYLSKLPDTKILPWPKVEPPARITELRPTTTQR
jgi:hypothetical protein